jgi:hypothetical protein
MADVVNLKNARKQKARNEREVQAASNRKKFGRTKVEKQLTKLELEREARLLDSHKRES